MRLRALGIVAVLGWFSAAASANAQYGPGYETSRCYTEKVPNYQHRGNFVAGIVFKFGPPPDRAAFWRSPARIKATAPQR